MPTETPSTRKLAAILFADIVGYTSLMQSDEAKALSSLSKFKEQLNILVPNHQGEIIQFYGDGCLAIFNSSVDAVSCAKNLQAVFQTAPQVPVRIGMHAGDIVVKEGNVFGDAVNIASRIESLGIPGSVLLSDSIRKQIKNQPDFQLASLGSIEFKNVEEAIIVFALSNKGLLVPNTKQLSGKLKSVPTAKLLNSKWILISLVLLAGIFGIYQWQSSAIASTDTSINTSTDKSIGVLPFKNFSSDESLEFFCDAMTDEVISRLANIQALDKVSSRTSVFKYKNSNKSLTEIAEELGVHHILESSFQKAGDQMRIKLNLIEVNNDRSIWNEEISGTWKSDDVFEIQARVAESVAKNMNLNLSLSDLQAVQQAATNNPEAYELYMLAEYQRHKENEQGYLNAVPLYEEAIGLDPNFSIAYESLGNLYTFGGLVWGIFDEKEALEKSSSYLKKAISIKPSARATKNLFAIEFYYKWNFKWCEENLDKIVKIFNIPEGDGTGDYLIKTGRYDQGFEWIHSFKEKFPLIPYPYAFEAKALVLVNRKEEAKALLKTWDPLSKDSQWYLRESAQAHFYLGQFDESKEKANIIKTVFSDRAPIHIWLDAVHAYHDKDLDSAEKFLDEIFQKYEKKASGSPAWFISMYFFFVEDVENGFKWLQTSFDDHEVEMTWLKEEPLLIPHRNDPRYIEIYNKMGWPVDIKN